MKKLLFTFCICLFATVFLDAQTNTFPSSGNVGIGTTNPSHKLELYGGGDFVIKGANNDAGDLVFQTNASAQLGRIWTNNSGESGLSMSSGDNIPDLTISSSGNIGIGTTTPSNVQGWQNVLDVYGANHSKIIATTSTSSVITGIFSHGSNWNGIVGRIGTESNHDLRLMAGYGLDQVTIKTSGNVGIGTTAPDAKLTVKGNIHTNEVKVDLLGAVAPDYVFYKDYDLKPLKAVEDYILSNGHLPNIPSAKDMETNGIMLKEMNLKLLEKIEELTLYAIQQENELQNQKVIIENLEDRLQKIETLLNSKKQ